MQTPVVMRTCTGCGETKPSTDFYKNRRDAKCKVCVNARNQEWYVNNKAKRRATMNAVYRTNKDLAIQRYGGQCACCGETETAFLVIDHINGDGSAERRILSNYQFAKRLATQPVDRSKYQVLCANCNHAKERPGGCPHQR